MFLTSDTHFFHNQVISYCSRPWPNWQEMNEGLIANWNSVVGKNDRIFVMGDFHLGRNAQVKDIVSRLNGRKILFRGNHDAPAKIMVEAGFDRVEENEIIKLPNGKPLYAKLVSAAFREVNKDNWKGLKQTSGDIIDKLAAQYATTQRWEKAVQHLRDMGGLQNGPQDIGPLMKAVNLDVYQECAPEIKEILFKWAWEKLNRRLTSALPGWYKHRLVEQQFSQTLDAVIEEHADTLAALAPSDTNKEPAA